MVPQPPTQFSHLDLASRSGVVAAVSGGGDSLALLFLLKTHLDTHAPRTRLLAVTVDHRLRAASTGEALEVARLCGRHGIEHRTVAWSGDKPGTGVSAAARDARHHLLADAARDAGTDLVLTGHTLDDQAETVAMRRARRDAGEGLSGIAPATLYRESVWFCRPLLAARRQPLRDWLSRRDIAWIDDPSNDDPASERVRVRSQLTEPETDALARMAEEAGRQRIQRSGEAALLIDEFASLPSGGLVRLDPRMFVPASEAAVLALRAILATVGGTPRLPDRARTEALTARLAAGPVRATLSRAVIDARPDGIWITREARSLPAVPLAGEPVVWDGRWRLSSGGARSGLTIGPWGLPETSGNPHAEEKVPRNLARAASAAEPGLFIGGEFVGHVAGPQAQASGVAATRIVAPHAVYLPSFDLALSGALRRLLDLPPLPRAPWKHHIEAGA